MDDLQLVRKVAEKVAECGGTAYFVGGYVRDKLLGKLNKDIDVEVYGIEPCVLENILSCFGEVVKCGVSFGVYNVKGYAIDFAFPRVERKVGVKHTDFEVSVAPYLSTEQASKRRDFTINAIMQNVLTGEIIDHWNGIADLKLGVIRHIDDNTFKEDVLRVFRAAQFAARFNFTIDAATGVLCSKLDLSVLSKERVFAEMCKALLKAEKPYLFFEWLKYIGQLDVWFPELDALIDAEQNKLYHQEGDVWRHTMLVLNAAAKRRDVVKNPLGFMLAALCHDMGKPYAKSVGVDGIVHTYGHEEVGVPIAERFLKRLTTDKKLIKYVLNMVALHMKPNIKAESKSKIKSTNKMFDQSVAPMDLILLAECDCEGKLPISGNNTVWLKERLDIYNAMMKKPYVMGRDLVDAGLEPCEMFTEVLAYAHKLRLAGVSKEHALSQVLWYARKCGCKRKDD